MLVYLYVLILICCMYFLDKYLYTTKETLEDFGPLLKMESSSDLCVSLYAKQCNDCKIKFYLKQKNSTSVLKEVHNVWYILLYL